MLSDLWPAAAQRTRTEPAAASSTCGTVPTPGHPLQIAAHSPAAAAPEAMLQQNIRSISTSHHDKDCHLESLCSGLTIAQCESASVVTAVRRVTHTSHHGGRWLARSDRPGQPQQCRVRRLQHLRRAVAPQLACLAQQLTHGHSHHCCKL